MGRENKHGCKMSHRWRRRVGIDWLPSRLPKGCIAGRNGDAGQGNRLVEIDDQGCINHQHGANRFSAGKRRTAIPGIQITRIQRH